MNLSDTFSSRYFPGLPKVFSRKSPRLWEAVSTQQLTDLLLFGSIETQQQCLKFSPSKMKEWKTQDYCWCFWLKGLVEKLGCGHIDGGWKDSTGLDALQSRADQMGKKGWAFPTNLSIDLLWPAAKRERRWAVRQHWKGNSNSVTLSLTLRVSRAKMMKSHWNEKKKQTRICWVTQQCSHQDTLLATALRE